MRVLRNGLSLLFFMLTTLSWANVPTDQTRLRVDLFVTSTCPHCQKADAYFKTLQAQEPWLDIHRFEIDHDKSALKNFHEALQQLQINDYSVPALFFCNTHWVGFDEAETTGAALTYALNYCHQDLMQRGQLNHETIEVLKQLAHASWLGTSMATKPSIASFLPSMALLDAFSPCSLFSVLALFSFLWLSKEYSVKIGLGILFITTLGVVHYIQQEHFAIFYHNLTWFRIPSALIGLGLIIYIFTIYFKKSIKGLSLLIVFTGLVMQAYQQNCLPNFALVFQQWLISEHYAMWQLDLYGVMYQLIYLLPLILLGWGFIYLHGSKRLDKFRTLLLYMAWCQLFLIALILIFFPEGLSSMKLSLTVLMLAFFTGLLASQQKERLGLRW